MAKKDLQLYVKNGCPFCRKVEGFMKRSGIELTLHNIDESGVDRSYLVEHGGKRQVPCLFIDGEAMYESNDIIDYLGREFGVSANVTDDAAAPAKASGGACSLDGSGCSF